MAGIKFSIPYNDDPKVLEKVFKLKTLDGNTVYEIYLAGPQAYSGSGRITDEIDLTQFVTLIDKIHSQGIRTNLVLNSTCEGTDWYSTDVMNAKLDYLELVHKEHGLEAVSIATQSTSNRLKNGSRISRYAPRCWEILTVSKELSFSPKQEPP